MSEKTGTIVVGQVVCPDGVSRGRIPTELIETPGHPNRGKPNPRYAQAMAAGKEKTVDKLPHSGKRSTEIPLHAGSEKAVLDAVRIMLSENTRLMLDPDKKTPVSVGEAYKVLADAMGAAVGKALGAKLQSLWVPSLAKTSAVSRADKLADVEEQ